MTLLRDALAAVGFFGGFAFGLRTSLVDLICPLAIIFPFDRGLLVIAGVGFRPGIEAVLQALEQSGAGKPCFSTALERLSNMADGASGGSGPVVERQPAAAFGRILALPQ